jgi:uridine phosphorylase/SAM-dependent methyltransferase
MMDSKQHWETVYSTRGERDVSWYESLPSVSMQMIEAAGLTPETCVIDVGGGDSRLVDTLAARGLDCLAVLDVSGAALHRAQSRLGEAAAAFTWIEADITADWALKPMDVWHDRAVFHFLTTPEDRARYRSHLRTTLKPYGTAIVATFALDGPETCSGLPVARYSPETLAAELGDEFRLIDVVPYEHRTPWGTVQPFIYARFTRVLPDAPILAGKDADAPSVFSPVTVLTEAKRQKHLSALRVPSVCVLDPDGDIVRWVKRTDRGTLSHTWACYHSELYEFDLAGTRIGIVGCAVGAPYAVLVAEQMFACGCELLVSITSAGQIARVAEPPYFVLVTRALRDEGTSYHYRPVARFAEGDSALLNDARAALRTAGMDVREGASWTTDAPFRETATAVSDAEREDILAVEMESAALYAFAAARGKRVLCFAHVTNTMGQRDREFEKGQEDGVTQSLKVIEAVTGVR